MKTIAITGATSFIGLNLIPRLLSRGYEVYAVVRTDSPKAHLLPRHENIHIVETSMCNYASLHKIIPTCDVFFAMAWDGTRGAQRDDRNLQLNNLQYSLDSINSILRLNPSMVISAGSQAEYGICTGLTSESEPELPVTEYGKAKLEFFREAQKLCGQNSISFKEPRFFSLYGAGDFEGTLMMSILIKMLKNEPCALTECIQTWDFMHIRDAVHALCKLIEKPCIDGVYNFGSGIAKPLREFVQTMHCLTKSASKLDFGAVPYAVSGMVNVHPDISKLCNQIQFEPQVPFEVGVCEIIGGILHEKN